MEISPDTTSQPLAFTGWDTPNDWHPKGLFFVGFRHHASIGSDGNLVISSSNDFCKDVRAFADDYISALRSEFGSPKHCKDNSDQRIGFFGRWVVWFGDFVALTMDLRAADCFDSRRATYVDVYLTFQKKGLADVVAWQQKVIGTNCEFPDA